MLTDINKKNFFKKLKDFYNNLLIHNFKKPLRNYLKKDLRLTHILKFLRYQTSMLRHFKITFIIKERQRN